MSRITPKEFFGFTPGDDRKMADWQELTGYYKALTDGSRRVRWVDMGESTEGRPMYFFIVSSPENLENLDEIVKVQARLADPRGLSPEEAQVLCDKGKTFVILSCSIHATEVGAAQMAPELLWELLTRDDEIVEDILENVVLLMVPSLNPDGLDLVVHWYRDTLGTPWEGSGPPFLYQKYSGHDNNRDWFMLNLVENRLTVEKIHNVFHPQIVFDLHQMGDNGFRLFLPPFTDPYDPNVDYILWHQIAELGVHMAGEVLAAGKTGVSWFNTYDGYSPSRAYQHYHGGVRILLETASVRLASPTHRKKDELRPTRDGLDPKVATWNHPAPWPGGDWRFRDIIEYEKIASYACLSHAAKFRHLWVKNFYNIGKRAVERKDVYAYVFPTDQKDPVMLYELLSVLKAGMVEIDQATEPFEVDGITFDAGSYVVRLAQPYGAFAKTLLEPQRYPDLRQYPGGPPKLPYDVTGHTLPLVMGVRNTLAKKPFEASLVPVQELPSLPSTVTATSSIATGAVTDEAQWFVISPSETPAAKVVNALLGSGVEVYRTTKSSGCIEAGAFLIPLGAAGQITELAPGFGVSLQTAGDVAVPKVKLSLPRIGVYKSYRGIGDEGWLRLVLEQYGFPFVSVTNQRIRQGGLAKEFDTIIFPSQPGQFIKEGNRPGSLPPEYVGGLGPEGKEAMAEFMEAGGVGVFIDGATGWVISELGLGCTNVVGDKKPQEFFVPGSILKTIIDTEHPLGYGLPRELPVVFQRSPAWDTVDGHTVARYPATEPLLSGWLLGSQFILNKASLVDYPVGKGKAVLFGWNPYFRAQARGTYKALFNSIYMGSSKQA